MKTQSLLPVFAAATLFLTPAVFAQTSSEPTATKDEAAALQRRKDREAELLKRYDKNGDGKLDEEEKAAAKMDLMKNGEGGRLGGGRFREMILKRFDKNGDGKLDETERAAALEALKKNPRFIQRFDKNGDGKLDDAELAAARQEIGARIAKRQQEEKD